MGCSRLYTHLGDLSGSHSLNPQGDYLFAESKTYGGFWPSSRRFSHADVLGLNCIHSHAAKYILAYRGIREYMDSSVAATKRCI